MARIVDNSGRRKARHSLQTLFHTVATATGTTPKNARKYAEQGSAYFKDNQILGLKLAIEFDTRAHEIKRVLNNLNRPDFAREDISELKKLYAPDNIATEQEIVTRIAHNETQLQALQEEQLHASIERRALNGPQLTLLGDRLQKALRANLSGHTNPTPEPA